MSKWARLAAWSLILGWCYLGTVLLLDAEVWGLRWNLARLLPLLALGGVVIHALAGRLARAGRLGPPHLQAITLYACTSLAAVLLLDVGFSVRLNRQAALAARGTGRSSDRHTWIAELYPRLYYPTPRNYRLHKPGVRISGSHYGAFYRPQMLRSPALVDSVLELRRITIAINALGFRDARALGDAEIFALGDSFTFGWGVDASACWVGVLERSIGRPVYNLGVHDASPRQEELLLADLLAAHPDSLHVRQLLWMIFEGNDLEDSYALLHPLRKAARRRRWLAGTLIEALARLPATIQQESVIDRARSGRLRLALPGRRGRRDPYHIDGVTLACPLYRSRRHGLRLFYPDYVERATRPAAYVRAHPNWPRLEQTFGDMAVLAARHGFRVAVILAPSAARVHGPQFEGFPGISPEPYFLEAVARLAAAHGFQVVDLLPPMRQAAGDTLLYGRDDDHWNRPGHRLAAAVIAAQVFGGRAQRRTRTILRTASVSPARMRRK